MVSVLIAQAISSILQQLMLVLQSLKVIAMPAPLVDTQILLECASKVKNGSELDL
jgi:hypothetical protein